MEAVKLLSVQPILLTHDVRKTAEFYLDVLGFFVPGYTYCGTEEVSCWVERDKVLWEFLKCPVSTPIVPIRQAVDAKMAWPAGREFIDVVVWVSNVKVLRQDLDARGAIIVQESNLHGIPMLVVEDCNGYHLGFSEYPEFE